MRPLRETVRSPPVVRGAAVGLLAFVLFVTLHALLVLPIWTAGLKGIPWAVAAGAGMGFLYDRHGRSLPFAGASRGAAFGGLAAVVLLPFAVAAILRHGGAGPVVWAGALALLLLAALAATFALVRPTPAERTRAALALFGGVLALNLLPGLFLTFVEALVDLEGEVPDPVPMAGAVIAIHVVAGAVLGGLLAGDPPTRGERGPA